MFMNLTCPACARPWRVPESVLGQQVQCPDCGSLFCSARCFRDHTYYAHSRDR